jgi:hypothetical protein
MSRVLGGGDDQRVWFGRAVAAQFDFVPAYESMLIGLMPRWGGSLAAQFAFAEALRQTARYDTPVPYLALQDLMRTAAELGEDWREVWRSDSVARCVLEICERYAAGGTCPSGVPGQSLPTFQTAFLWASGQYEAAHRLIGGLPYGLLPEAVDAVLPLARTDVIEAETATGAGAYGEPLCQALRFLDEGKVPEARRLLANTTPQTPAEAFAWVHLSDRSCSTELAPGAAAADLVAVFVRLHRREALLLAYARAVQEHGAVAMQAVQASVTEELGPMAMAFVPTVPPLGALGRADIRRGLEEVDRVSKAWPRSDAGGTDRADADDVLLQTHRSLARLRWLLRADVSHEKGPVGLYASRVVGAEVRSVKHPGLLLDFMSEWFRSGMMDDTLASHVGQVVHDSVALARDRRKEAIQQEVAALASVGAPEELDRRCLELLLTTGTPRLNLEMARLLDAQGRHAVSAVIDWRTRLWVWRFCEATRLLGVWSPWQCMATFNRVEGYEAQVVYYGAKAHFYSALNSSEYMAAAACLRRGWVSPAVKLMLDGRALPDDQDEFEDPDGVYHGTDAYVRQLLIRVIESGKATEEQMSALRVAFPQQFPAAKGQSKGP